MSHLTPNEVALLNELAASPYKLNGSEPPRSAEDATMMWWWPSDLCLQIGLSEQELGGVASSLIKKGLITIHPSERTDEDDTVSFTEAGFKAWAAAR